MEPKKKAPLPKKVLQREKKSQKVKLVVSSEDNNRMSYVDRYIKMQAFAAVLFGWHSAAILENIRQWTDYAKTEQNSFYFRNGQYWTRRSFEDLHHDLFGMVSIRTLKERVGYLKSIGVIVSRNFNTIYESSEGYTRKGQTKWYRIDREMINRYAVQLDEYILSRLMCFMDERDTYLNALSCIGQRNSSGMGFIIYDFKEKKVGFAPAVIKAYGQAIPKKNCSTDFV